MGQGLGNFDVKSMVVEKELMLNADVASSLMFILCILRFLTGIYCLQDDYIEFLIWKNSLNLFYLSENALRV